jgi:hypothetical protein
MTSTIITMGPLGPPTTSLDTLHIPFRIEKFWIDHPTFKDNINQWWQDELPYHGTRMFKLYKKLKYIKQKLKEWNREVFGNINQGKKKYRGQDEEVVMSLSK